MRVIKADVLGMCFGVRDALKLIEEIDRPSQVTIHGELVHNEKVLDRLQSRGFTQLAEGRRQSLPLTETVLITAHGISDKERRRLLHAGKALIDSTCPLVTRAHVAAQKLRREGRHVLVIGRRGHVEVQGIIEDLPSHDVLESVADVRSFAHSRLGIVCQTTTPAPHAAEIRRAIAEQNPLADIAFIDTICHPTKDHQSALERLLGQVEAVVVVGGRNSNNTRQLVRRCQERGVRAFHVQSAEDLHPDWFEGVSQVGLTAGTSTLDETIEAVQQALEEMGNEKTAADAPRFSEWAVLGSNQ